MPSADDAALAGRHVIVMGLGRFGGGVGVTRWLAAQGARLTVTDSADASNLADSIAKLGDLEIEYRLGGHDPRMLVDAELLVVNPAVPKDRSPFIQEASRRQIHCTTEINLFLERCPARVVGVTGTAGKSTTAAMIHEVLGGATTPGNTYLGGNIGGSLLEDVATMSPEDVVVLELSSFQLADLSGIARRPDLGVIVSLWPHHMDRHGTFEAYLDAKLNMIRGAVNGTPLVIGFDDAELMARVSRVANENGVRLLSASDYAPSARLRIPGEHNRMNARCAAAVCAELGVDDETVRVGLERFRGLPHRLQHVGCIDGVDYYNDSKSTTLRWAAAALRAFDRPVIALIGGKPRSAPHDELIAAVAHHAGEVVCFGTVGASLHDAVAERAAGGMVLHRADALADAFAIARRDARDGDVVLLSPGFESYDAFVNYEQRGDEFAALVHVAGAAGDRSPAGGR